MKVFTKIFFFLVDERVICLVTRQSKVFEEI